MLNAGLLQRLDDLHDLGEGVATEFDHDDGQIGDRGERLAGRRRAAATGERHESPGGARPGDESRQGGERTNSSAASSSRCSGTTTRLAVSSYGAITRPDASTIACAGRIFATSQLGGGSMPTTTARRPEPVRGGGEARGDLLSHRRSADDARHRCVDAGPCRHRRQQQPIAGWRRSIDREGSAVDGHLRERMAHAQDRQLVRVAQVLVRMLTGKGDHAAEAEAHEQGGSDHQPRRQTRWGEAALAGLMTSPDGGTVPMASVRASCSSACCSA